MKQLFNCSTLHLTFGVALLLTIFSKAYPQGCQNYYFLHNNAEVQITLYDAKGEKAGVQTWIVSGANQESNEWRATVTGTMVNAKGEELTKSTGTYRCNEGKLMADVRMVLPYNEDQKGQPAPATTAKMEQGYVEYPATLTEGMQLPDAMLDMEVTTSGAPGAARIEMTNRKVVGKETVTSEAGTWEAYKITYDTEMKMRVAGLSVPVSMKTTEWFVPGFGVVKTESFNKKGKKRGATLLTALKI